MGPEVKICGLMRPEDAAVAGSAGADYVGVIFADSRRRVAADRGREILDGASAYAARRVGVFGASDGDAILQTATTARVDVLQLHGGFDATEVSYLRRNFSGTLWGVVRVPPKGIDAEDWARWDEVDAVVVDTWTLGALGGTGVPFDWVTAAAALSALRGKRPIVLAGGLTPENVASGMATLTPDVVDVSSGVERIPGEKDPARIAAFVRAVRGESP
ncbi:MAG: phosphoribosylanthranilate isomerase [Gemmatimonadaceae bacterium]